MIRKIIRGAGYLPGYGDHPGTGMVVFLILATGAAGIKGGGWLGFLVGCGLGLAIYGPLWAWGCYDRASAYDRRRKQ